MNKNLMNKDIMRFLVGMGFGAVVVIVVALVCIAVVGLIVIVSTMLNPFFGFLTLCAIVLGVLFGVMFASEKTVGHRSLDRWIDSNFKD